MQLFYQPGIQEDELFLDAEESRHCIKVLRKKKGELIQITDGSGFLYTAQIVSDNPSKCEFSIQEKILVPERKFHVHVAIAPTKSVDRMEWFVEKTTEIGIDEISFIETHHSERKNLKIDRFSRKATSAMKQSMKTRIPALNGLAPLHRVVDELENETDVDKFIATVDTDPGDHLHKIAVPGRKSCVLIGPEGDFSGEELDYSISHGFRKVSLGTSRLRTETAGVVACHILNLINS